MITNQLINQLCEAGGVDPNDVARVEIVPGNCVFTMWVRLPKSDGEEIGRHFTYGDKPVQYELIVPMVSEQPETDDHEHGEHTHEH
jgi:hypothetical protein